MTETIIETVHLDCAGRFDIHAILQDSPGYKVCLGEMHEWNDEWDEPYRALCVYDNDASRVFAVYGAEVKTLTGGEYIDLRENKAFIATHLVIDENARLRYIGHYVDANIEIRCAVYDVLLDEPVGDLYPDWAKEDGNILSKALAPYKCRSRIS